MPCYTYESEAEKEAAQLSRFNHNSPVAEMLCDVLSRISDEDIATLPEATRDWWITHQLRDITKQG